MGESGDIPGATGSQVEGAEATFAERLAQGLEATVLPAWRKAYLANLIASGIRFAETGNARGSGYCFAKVEAALRSQPASDVPPSAPAQPTHPRARPSDSIRSRWREDRIGQAEKVLAAHGARLSSLEKRTYRERLDKLRKDAGQSSLAGKSDAGLLELRRRLYQRVLKSQKNSLARKRAPVPARPAGALRPSATAAAWQPVTGPYNDRSNLEELLAVIGAADPAWVEEFLELYGNLTGLNALIASTIPRQ
jgi:hypothetical protein